ncbi:MAG: hypothetical protein A3F54_02660 [Candidatus Kerfeldbacteria bacterium RIFCSPHIGHO2_12_FULL_48_17]|uniref:Uncharacterized protein n=1 Tax=Candidatus Kerfeldbacteria bacterium RIFCSPHIGHO2_12_FULL_48_17 TaxID=1798542 RepID=A0A1G2AX40_9BACT|nr:MAG: hypothetical protein A3F54_02660 [Candidatus Kerfeldbacteria bacterium RIFCSPHIGHO2_12_FULL_48_17]
MSENITQQQEGFRIQCPDCQGKGWNWEEAPRATRERETCNRCNNTGKIEFPDQPLPPEWWLCPYCDSLECGTTLAGYSLCGPLVAAV